MNVEDYKAILAALYERLVADAKLTEPQYASVVSALERKALAAVLGREEENEFSQSLPTLNRPDAGLETPDEARSSPRSIDLSCLGAEPDPNYVVCIDFGTAKSKAFASRLSVDTGDEMNDGLELGLGKLDNDLDGAVYSVASSVWISDDGRMFAGSEALRLSAQYALSTDRERLDSIKQQLSQTNHRDSLDHLLHVAIKAGQSCSPPQRRKT